MCFHSDKKIFKENLRYIFALAIEEKKLTIEKIVIKNFLNIFNLI